MPAGPLAPEVRCPRCGRLFDAGEAWRLARCPSCGEVLVRMADEPEYD